MPGYRGPLPEEGRVNAIASWFTRYTAQIKQAKEAARDVGSRFGPQSKADKQNMTDSETKGLLKDIRDGIKKLSDKPGLNLFGVEVS